MSKVTDWLPSRREEKLAMAKNWVKIAGANKTAWGIPPAEISELDDLRADAEDVLELAMSADRTQVITARCRAAFETLDAKMRFFKKHYFLVPPLTEADMVSLGFKTQNQPTPIPAPTAQADADISRPGVHLLELHLHPVAGSPSDPHCADYGFRVYWGVMPQGGATVEAATGSKRELIKAPVSGKELPHSKFVRRKKELFDFAQEDSGKTVYFCIQYENAKGDQGHWGPMFSAVIP
jgi:hypothetical protein